MFSHFNIPPWYTGAGAGCSRRNSSARPSGRRCSARPSDQYRLQEIDLAEVIDSIITAATVAQSVAEPWISELAEQLKKANNQSKSSEPKNYGHYNTSVSAKDDKFEVKIDVNHFKPEEITVKVVENSIVVEARHEEKEENDGFISRQFIRRFVIPGGVVLEKMTCTAAADNNTIVISAPIVVQKPNSNEMSIPIRFVGQTAKPTQVSPTSTPTPTPTPNTEEPSANGFEFINA